MPLVAVFSERQRALLDEAAAHTMPRAEELVADDAFFSWGCCCRAPPPPALPPERVSGRSLRSQLRANSADRASSAVENGESWGDKCGEMARCSENRTTIGPSSTEQHMSGRHTKKKAVSFGRIVTLVIERLRWLSDARTARTCSGPSPGSTASSAAAGSPRDGVIS